MSEDGEALRRAGRAKAELAETDAAFAQLREAAIKRWASTTATQTDVREALYRSVGTINAVQEALKRLVDGGRIAEAMAALTEEEK